MSEDRKFKWVGTRPIRHDGVDKVTGRANYGADFELPGMLHGSIARSPHAHARIVSIDIKPALAIDGVRAVVTGADLPEHSPKAAEGPVVFADLSRNILARDKVLYDGHAIAAVAATTPEIAKQAAEAISVEYDVLEPVLDVMQAMRSDAPLLHDEQIPIGLETDNPSNIAARTVFDLGDVEQGFRDADVVIERDFETATVHQGYIEPHATVASVAEDGQTLVWCSTQGAFMVRGLCARLLNMDLAQIKVIPSEIGGGFGGKTTIYLEPVAILLSQKSGRPVKMVMSRSEVLRASGPASGTFVRVKLGAKKDGTLTAADASLYYEAGAFKGSPVAAGAMCIFAPYDIPNCHAEAYDVVVNKPKVAAYRAPGSPQAAFATEQVIDELARKLEMDPLVLRLKNAAKEGTKAMYGARFKQIGLVDVVQAMKAHPHYSAPLGENQGRGVALGFWFNGGMSSSATVQITEKGTAVVATGNPDIGGSRASMALMAAEELQIPVTQIRPMVVDTDSIPYSDLTGGSRTTVVTGAAVIEAAKQCVDQLRKRAALLWDVSVEDVAWQDGRAIPQNGAASSNEPLSIADIARKAGRTGGPIAGLSTLSMQHVGPGFGGHICDVEVDPDTGAVKILRYTAFQDVGKAIHPSYVEGQMQGGAVQGIGWALNEEYIYDAEGHLENASFLDYRMPVASDVPMIETVMIEVPAPNHPYGARGVGETPICPPLGTIANAVHDAIGVRMTSLPMSPPKILEVLHPS